MTPKVLYTIDVVMTIADKQFQTCHMLIYVFTPILNAKIVFFWQKQHYSTGKSKNIRIFAAKNQHYESFYD
jgi:hypothetical protein